MDSLLGALRGSAPVMMLVESVPERTVEDDDSDEEGVEGEAVAAGATWAVTGERVVDLLTEMGGVTSTVADSAGSGLVLPKKSGGACPVVWSESSISKEGFSSSWRAKYRYDPFALVRRRKG